MQWLLRTLINNRVRLNIIGTGAQPRVNKKTTEIMEIIKHKIKIGKIEIIFSLKSSA